jgi:hypothetical protein
MKPSLPIARADDVKFSDGTVWAGCFVKIKHRPGRIISKHIYYCQQAWHPVIRWLVCIAFFVIIRLLC